MYEQAIIRKPRRREQDRENKEFRIKRLAKNWCWLNFSRYYMDGEKDFGHGKWETSAYYARGACASPKIFSRRKMHRKGLEGSISRSLSPPPLSFSCTFCLAWTLVRGNVNGHSWFGVLRFPRAGEFHIVVFCTQLSPPRQNSNFSSLLSPFTKIKIKIENNTTRKCKTVWSGLLISDTTLPRATWDI